MIEIAPQLSGSLPSGKDILLQICRSAVESSGSDLDVLVARTWNVVTNVHVQHVAWSGEPELGATIVLCAHENKNLFLDAVAELLWATRHQKAAHE
jgi:hypothetical protein